MVENTSSQDLLDQLGRTLQPIVYGDTEVRKYLQEKFGVTITRADFYSEIPTVQEIENSTKTPSLLSFKAVFGNNEILIGELENLYSVATEFNPPVKSEIVGEYAWEGGPFSFSDAIVYYSMIRTKKPKTIVEIGSGWSTLVARAACDKNGFGRIICVEPYPSEFLRNLKNIELIEKRIQEIETPEILSLLADGDFLFIDSTHTVKHDSDCLHIYLRLLPNIKVNINVHVHDIYLPDARPVHLLLNHHTYWNEQYLLYAYLISNPRTRVIYGSWYHWISNRPQLERLMGGKYQAGGNSLWFEQNIYFS